MTNQNRVPAGSPEGGQYASGGSDESSLTSLDSPMDQDILERAERVTTNYQRAFYGEEEKFADDIERTRAFVDSGGSFRPSTIERIERAERLPEAAASLQAHKYIMRDVNYAGREHLLDQALANNAPSRLFDFENAFGTTPEDFDAVRREPSPTLVHMLQTMEREPHIRWDRNVADMAYRQAQWHAGKRAYGDADISDLPQEVQDVSEEEVPGVVTAHAVGGGSIIACSPQRNAEIPSRFRSEDGRYYGDIGFRAVYRTFPGEAIHHASWYPSTHAKMPRSNAEYQSAVEESQRIFHESPIMRETSGS